MKRVIRVGWLLAGLLSGLLLAGCSTQPYPEVPVEEKGYGIPQPSISGQIGADEAVSKPSLKQDATVAAPAPAPASSTTGSARPQSSAAAGRKTSPDTPADLPASVAPPSSRHYAGPSPALLALMEKADQLESRGQSQAAIAQLERAQRIAPRDPMVYLQLARLRLHMNDRSRAEQLARRGLSLSGGDPDLEAAFKALLAELRR